LPEEERKNYYQTFIDSLIAKEEALKEKEEIEMQLSGMADSGFSTPRNTFGTQNNDDTFYYYNQTTRQYGIDGFKRLWGNRTLEDNWRLSNKTVVNRNTLASNASDTISTRSSDVYTVEYYTNRLPTQKEKLDSLVIERNFAN